MDEPKFESDLVNQKLKAPLKFPVGLKAKPKSKRPDFFKLGLRRSLWVHAAFLIVYLVYAAVNAFVFAPTEAQRKAAKERSLREAIRVDVVDLPSLKLSDMKKLDPSLDVDAASEINASYTKPSEPRVSSKAMTLADSKKGAHKDDKKNPEKDRIEEIRERLRADARRKELALKLTESSGREGRPILAGNKISAGTSITGDIASETEAYNGKLRSHLHRVWEIPAWMNASNLSAVVVVKIGSDGRITKKEFTKRSGNSDFDATVERAIERASPFPAPPRELAATYLEEGVAWKFPR
jgi:TonB family protein